MTPEAEDVPLVARVNGEGITQEEFDAVYQLVLKQQPPTLTQSERFNLRVNVLNDLIMTRMLKQKALEADPPVAATEVEEALRRVRLNFHNNEREFQKSLQNQNVTLEQFKKTIENELKVKIFQKMVEESFQVQWTEEDLRDWYDEHREEYKTSEVLQVSHILIPLSENASEEEVEKARQQLLSIRERIVTLGADFGEMANLYSGDPESATAGGVLGTIARGMLVEPFEQAAFSLPEGGISQPVRTYKGWHLIKVNRRIPGRQLSFEEARDKGLLQNDYVAYRRGLYFSDWLRSQRTKTKVEILDTNLVRVR